MTASDHNGICSTLQSFAKVAIDDVLDGHDLQLVSVARPTLLHIVDLLGPGRSKKRAHIGSSKRTMITFKL